MEMAVLKVSLRKYMNNLFYQTLPVLHRGLEVDDIATYDANRYILRYEDGRENIVGDHEIFFCMLDADFVEEELDL